MKNFLETIKLVIGAILFTIILAGFLRVLVGPMLQVWAPIITFLVVLALTVHTFKRWTDAMLAIVGIAIYAISWSVVHYLGDLSAQLLCSAGLFLWLAAIGRSFTEYYVAEQQSQC